MCTLLATGKKGGEKSFGEIPIQGKGIGGSFAAERIKEGKGGGTKIPH